MSQYGMQMPGGQGPRRASPNVYTGLLFLACVALVGAFVFVAIQAQKLAPDGNLLKLQEADNIVLSNG